MAVSIPGGASCCSRGCMRHRRAELQIRGAQAPAALAGCRLLLTNADQSTKASSQHVRTSSAIWLASGKVTRTLLVSAGQQGRCS